MTNIVDEMPEIPRPDVLDPDRVNRDERESFTREDHRTRAQLFLKALDDTSAYANTLWDVCAAVRVYLHDHTPVTDADAEWREWQEAYAAVVSVLCGPHGDSGFGASQAGLIAQTRRSGE